MHPYAQRFAAVGLRFQRSEDGFLRCKEPIEIELQKMEDLIDLQERVGVLITVDGKTLILDNP